MTEKKVHYVVSRVVAAAKLVREKCYHICWWEDQVQCHHVHHTKDSHEIFYTAIGYVFLDGLSEFQWKLVTTRILEFCRSQGIELDLRSGRRKTGRRHERSRRCLTAFDSERLRILLASARTPGSKLNAYLDRLQRLLEAADIVAPRDVPRDVVTMNSKVRLKDDEAGEDMALSLVFPADAAQDADPEKFDVSILSPLGLSLLGRRIGDIVGRRVRIDELLYQPEAAGEFHL
jgi:regulator of nucleoside diphosphate kinase